MRRVLISGLGLMGGSLAAALTAAGWSVLLHHRRPGPAAAAAARGWGQEVDHPGELAADLAVVAVPVSAIPTTVRQLAAAQPDAVITDLGSVKAAICLELDDLAAAGRFVGSHPMCGSHCHGLDHADPNLYRGATCIVTPHATAPANAEAAVAALWEAVGCRLLRLSPLAHDRAVAEASHLPHILASCAAGLLGEAGLPVAASGFRDTTRVAAGQPALWSDILMENQTAVRALLSRAGAHLAELDRALAHGDAAAVQAWLEHGRAARARFDAQRGSGS